MKKLTVFIFTFCSFWGAALAQGSNITQWTTSSGARVFFLQANDIPMVDVAIDLDAGSRWDPADQAGLAAMTQALMLRGIKPQSGLPGLSELEISEAFAALAVQYGGSVSLDRASLSFRMLSDHEVRDATAALAARLIAHPAYDAEILSREKNRTIAAIQESLTQPQAIARRALWKAVYGDHPYGAQPTAASVESIAANNLLAFHQKYWQPARMRITIVGALTQDQARAWVDQLLQFMPQTPALPISVMSQVPGNIPPLKGRAHQAIAHPAAQSHVWLGLPAMSRSDPDFFALTVGNYILGGGGFVSRLTEEIREKRGLSYSVFSAFQPLAQPGPFMIGLQTQKARAPEALSVVRDTVQRFLKEGPTEQELKAAKQNLVGGFALRVDTNRKLLDNLAQINFYDLPLDYLQTWTDRISAVSAKDIRQAMNRVISMDQLTAVVVGGPEGFIP
jgi:zinc protease